MLRPDNITHLKLVHLLGAVVVPCLGFLPKSRCLLACVLELPLDVSLEDEWMGWQAGPNSLCAGLRPSIIPWRVSVFQNCFGQVLNEVLVPLDFLHQGLHGLHSCLCMAICDEVIG